ncbi:MAG: ASKHA domain-containing protein [Nitrospirae bacterium]|nr:ASKHA domain-containing protein [Nitrospirota bacterium]
MNDSAKITVLPRGTVFQVSRRESLFQVLTTAGISLNSYCGGQGICGKCRVRLIGNVPLPSESDLAHLSSEEINEGIRLACGLYPDIDMVAEIPEPVSASEYKLNIGDMSCPLDPWRDRLSGGVVLAVDLGTTNIVGHLLDPRTGKIIASATIANSQALFGADVMTRLAYCSHHGKEAKKTFENLALSDIEKLAESAAGRGKGRITDAVAVMNTAMETLLLGLSPDKLGRYPYKSGIDGPMHISPFKRGPLRRTAIHIPPVIGGFVGSDTVSALFAVSVLNQMPPYLLVDMGTNAEVVVVTRETMLACSTAAGPAFEGVGISCGMRGVEGAVESVRFNEGAFKVSVIGNKPAAGVTGSGLFSLIGELLRGGALDRFGAMVSERIPHNLVRRGKSGREVILSPDVTVSEEDIQQFILAKAATRAAVDTVLARVNLRADEITAIFLSGVFAGRINPRDVLTTGLLPPLELRKIQNAGNAPATGAVMMALSVSAFQKACLLARRVKHLTLSGSRDFKETFQSHVRL